MGSLCAGVSYVSFLSAGRERVGYVLFEVGVVEGSDGWMMEEDSAQRREEGGI